MSGTQVQGLPSLESADVRKDSNNSAEGANSYHGRALKKMSAHMANEKTVAVSQNAVVSGAQATLLWVIFGESRKEHLSSCHQEPHWANCQRVHPGVGESGWFCVCVGGDIQG